MSKRSRKRNRVLAAMVGLAGASKLGLLNKMPKSITGDKFAAARKAMTSDTAMKGVSKVKGDGPLKGVVQGITKLKRSDLPEKRNLKSIFVGDDGSITKGLEKFKDKKTYAETMRKRRGTPSFKEFMNKMVLGPKTQMNKGKMVKARGGGMARMKPTKLY